jgi:hypothetical protein
MHKHLTAALLLVAVSCVGARTPADTRNGDTIKEVNSLYRALIDAENRHDLAAVRTMVWQSHDMLFVAKTATPAEGNWAGFWGTDVVLQHFHDLYQGVFVMEPDYSRVKTVTLTKDVAETYAPLNISVGYAGQTPVPKPFLMIVTWIRTPAGWRMATDIALPIPPAPTAGPHPPTP